MGSHKWSFIPTIWTFFMICASLAWKRTLLTLEYLRPPEAYLEERERAAVITNKGRAVWPPVNFRGGTSGTSALKSRRGTMDARPIVQRLARMVAMRGPIGLTSDRPPDRLRYDFHRTCHVSDSDRSRGSLSICPRTDKQSLSISAPYIHTPRIL